MDDKNFLLAIVLCVGVYAIWFGFVEPRVPAQPAAARPQAAAPPAAAPAPEEAAEAKPSAPPKILPKALEFKVPDAEIQISPLGAAITSYRYRGPLGPVELVVEPSPGIFSTWPDVVFSPIAVPRPHPGNVSPSAAVFEARLPSGLLVRKEFGFAGAGALGSLRLTLYNPGKKAVSPGAWDLQLGPGLGTVPNEQNDNAKLWRAIGLFPPPPGRTQDVLEHLKIGEHEGPWRWLAIDNRYFLAAALASPDDFDRSSMDAAKIEVPYRPSFMDRLLGRVYRTQQVSAPSLRIQPKALSLAPGASKAYDIPFYVGPKSYTPLERLHRGLERSVNFGWFDTLGRWMLWLLQALYRLTGNYGWSIILLTVLIQAMLFPLTFKSLKSMAKMKKIQPEMARLQQKYKGDPQRLNAEMMELYKSKGVNPMGGCLPMLAQMPIFVALFNALRNAWELHGAPWIGWVRDLSAHDPFYILPVVMGGVMFVQNRLNPAAAADPTQAAMMKWMPILFTLMFINFPAGLVLYWLTNSALSTAQQAVLRDHLAA